MLPGMEVFAERHIGTSWEGRYDITAVIGGGGMGTVYAARHSFTGREVALKLLHPDVANSPAARERFLREARAPAKVEHPAIVPVLDAGIAGDGTPYLAFERLYGHDLGAALRRAEVDGEALIDVVLELLAALSVAHAAGLVHRDIKPENVFLEQQEGAKPRVRLLDFGITRPALEASEGSLTQTGSLVGTPDYLSPEQAEGRPIDQRSDLFSVGGLMFYGLTGQRAFSGENALRRLVALLTTEAPPIQSVRPEVPDDLAAVVMRALRHHPEQRFDSAQEMARVLRELERPVVLAAIEPERFVVAEDRTTSGPRVIAAASGKTGPASLLVTANTPPPPLGALGVEGLEVEGRGVQGLGVQGLGVQGPEAQVLETQGPEGTGTLPVAGIGRAGEGARQASWLRTRVWGARRSVLQWALVGASIAILATIALRGASGTRAWSPGLNLEGDASEYSYEPRVIAHPSRPGEVAVAWVERGGVKLRHGVRPTSGLASWWRPEFQWGGVVKLDRRGDPADLAIGVDASGRLLAVWALTPRGSDMPERGVWYSTSDDWEHFAEPIQVFSGDTFGELRLAVSASGKARLIFNEWLPPDLEVGRGRSLEVIWTAAFDGASFQPAQPIGEPARSQAIEARVAIDGQGSGLIAWMAEDASQDSLYLVEFSPDALREPQLVARAEVNDFAPSLAMNPAGEGMLAWAWARRSSSADSGAGKGRAEYPLAELWAARVQPGAGITFKGAVAQFGSLGDARVQLDAAGNAAIVYRQGSGDIVTLSGRADGSWDDDPTLLARSRSEKSDPRLELELGPDGSVFASWIQLEPAAVSEAMDPASVGSAQAPEGAPTYALWGALRPAGGDWGPAERIQSLEGLRIGSSSLALLADREVVAAWTYFANQKTDLPVRQVHVSARTR